MKFVRILLDGRFGNHLFQVATGLALARARDAYLVVDPCLLPKIGSGTIFRRLEVLRFRFPRRRSSILLDRWNLRWRGRHTYELQTAVMYREPDHRYDPSLPDLDANVVLRGYFQNERYFDRIAPELRKWFDLSPWLQRAPREYRLAAAREHSVGMHVRRTDYLLPVHRHFQVCGREYYDHAMARARARLPGCQFLIFSDDVRWCREHFTAADCQVVDSYTAPDAGLIDFALLSACRHQIISNSSYAWWAAWLNPNPARLVFSPDRWTNDGSIPLETKRFAGLEPIPA